jgi:NAD(P)-dependent dehydrogenase (short-subunit alcohol dehydrogenase family)
MKVLVTGSSRGIGRAVTTELVERGHEVIATARRRDAIEALGAAEVYELDITKAESVRRVVSTVGDCDVLVNAAGAPLISCPIEYHPIDDFQEQLEVNFLGPIRMIQAVLPAMRRRGSGHLITIGSITGRVAQPLRGAANSSKFALEGMHEALKYEVNHFGVKVTLVEPGATQNQPGKVKYAQRDQAEAYGPLFDQFDRAEAGLTASVPRQVPDDVARAVADCIEQDNPPFRLQLGGDADKIMAIRRRTSDEEWEATMREMLEISW